MPLYKTVADINGGTQVEMTADEEAAHIEMQDAHAAAQPRLDLLAQIVNLEAQQTPRRVRERALNPDDPFLSDLETQIAILREQL